MMFYKVTAKVGENKLLRKPRMAQTEFFVQHQKNAILLIANNIENGETLFLQASESKPAAEKFFKEFMEKHGLQGEEIRRDEITALSFLQMVEVLSVLTQSAEMKQIKMSLGLSDFVLVAKDHMLEHVVMDLERGVSCLEESFVQNVALNEKGTLLYVISEADTERQTDLAYQLVRSLSEKAKVNSRRVLELTADWRLARIASAIYPSSIGNTIFLHIPDELETDTQLRLFIEEAIRYSQDVVTIFAASPDRRTKINEYIHKIYQEMRENHKLNQ